jgi:peptide/nickel transport system permease protein
MWSRIISRLLTSVMVAWASVTAAFVALHALPGRIEDILAGDLEYPGLRESIAAEWGLDRSLFAQYLDFLVRIANGDFGTSYVLRQPVTEVVGSQLIPTVQLALLGGVLAILIAVSLAVLTAGRGRISRQIASFLELVFASTPVFWLGILLLMAFSFTLRWFPVSGANGWRSIVLPALTLALPTAGLLAQVLREAMEKTLDQSFVTTVRSRGVSEFMIRARHVLRHALPFGKAILPRRGWCNGLVPDAHGTQSARDDNAVDSIPISDHIARSHVSGKRLG